MNYQLIYDQLVTKRRNEPILEGYTEKHHILPTSMGGSNSEDNLILLTGREHWVAHLLLHKIHKLPQTAYACHMMTMRCEERGIPFVKNSRMYEYIRKQHSKFMSHIGKKRLGTKNGSYGTMWICNMNLKENRKIKKTDKIPHEWIRGRNQWNKDKEYVRSVYKIEKECVICNKKFFGTHTTCGHSCGGVLSHRNREEREPLRIFLHPKASDENILEIYDMLESGEMKVADIATVYGLSRKIVYKIRNKTGEYGKVLKKYGI